MTLVHRSIQGEGHGLGPLVAKVFDEGDMLVVANATANSVEDAVGAGASERSITAEEFLPRSTGAMPGPLTAMAN